MLKLKLGSKREPDKSTGIDWIEHSLTSLPTQYRLYGRRFLQSKDPTNSVKVLKEKATEENPENANNKIHTQIRNIHAKKIHI